MAVEPNGREPKEAEPSSPPEVATEKIPERRPLEFLRDTERSLRNKTVGTIVPILSEEAALKVQEVSDKADETLDQLATIDLDSIDDRDLRSPRIFMGLAFVGFGALMILFLLVYLSAIHPELNAVDRIQTHWYQYVWFVCIGVAGMFMLGREAMRPAAKVTPQEPEPSAPDTPAEILDPSETLNKPEQDSWP